MTFPPAPGGTARPRPTVVTAACVVMFAVAAVSVIRQVFAVVTGLPQLSTTRIVVGIAVVAFAVALGVLAFYNLRGVNGSRIGTWSLVGLLAVSGLCVLGRQAITGRSLNGYDALWLGLNVIEFAAYVAIIVLLALPAAHQFFRPAPQPHLPPHHPR